MNKKIRKLKDREKNRKQSEKVRLIKINKKRMFYEKLEHFIQCRAYFRPFIYVIVAYMRVSFSKMVTKLPYFFCVIVHFCTFSGFFCPFSFLYYRLLKKTHSRLPALEYELRCYYYLQILYYFVVYIYMYK